MLLTPHQIPGDKMASVLSCASWACTQQFSYLGCKYGRRLLLGTVAAVWPQGAACAVCCSKYTPDNIVHGACRICYPTCRIHFDIHHWWASDRVWHHSCKGCIEQLGEHFRRDCANAQVPNIYFPRFSGLGFIRWGSSWSCCCCSSASCRCCHQGGGRCNDARHCA
jgi:hypothetical protein